MKYTASQRVRQLRSKSPACDSTKNVTYLVPSLLWAGGRSKTEMAKLSELVRGFRANIREGIPTILFYDGETIKLNCSPNINGFVGLATRKSKYDTCTMWNNCKDCVEYLKETIDNHPHCKLNLIKPVLSHLKLNQ